MVRSLSQVLGLYLMFNFQHLHGQSNVFEHIHIGTKWIYETAEYLIPSVQYRAQTFVITDTSSINGNQVFVVENDMNNQKEYIWLEGQNLYFWDADLQDFQLNYVFDTISSYESNWTGRCHAEEDTAIVHIDSLSSLIFDQDSLVVQHITISDNGSTEDDMNRQVYVGIGQNTGGLKLQLGLGLCDFYFQVTQLRCFESSLASYNFVDYACDSTWLDLNISTKTLHQDDFVVFPNPGLNNLTIDVKGFDPELLRVDLIDATGVVHFSKQDLSYNIQIPTLPAGQYYYRIFKGEQLLGVGVWVNQ